MNNIISKRIAKVLAIGGAMLFAACSQNPHWGVEGTIEGAEPGTKIALEGFNNQAWYVIDSLTVGSNGKFSYASPQPAAYPDIYRLTLDGKSVYFPIDSLETITVNADASAFDRKYTLEGSTNAWLLMTVNHRIDSVADAKGANLALDDFVLKTWLNHLVLADTVGTISYFIINKSIAGQPLYSPTNKRDVGIVGAVAQKFVDRRPNDPRTPYIKQLALDLRRGVSPVTSTFNVSQTGFFEVELPDENGEVKKLSDLISKGKVVVLSFTNYDSEWSPAYNVILNRLHESGAADIYQVGVANDEINWRRSARNLPWTTVWSNEKQSTDLMRKFNFVSIPTTYILNREGDIVERVDDPSTLEAAVRKY